MTKNEVSKLKHWSVLVLASAFFSPSAVASPIKLSNSGICHDESSRFYGKTRHYSAFPSMPDCIRAGGRAPKEYGGGKTTVADSASYSRSKFGSGWADTDGDCQDSRQETLVAHSTAPVRFKAGRNCSVTAGRWISPFTGAVIHDPSKIDIDHVLPLRFAWDHGADRWAQDQRERFANDPLNLISVESSLNRSKGAKGPGEWLPPANQCSYIARFTRVSIKYRIELSPEERGELRSLREHYCS